MHTASELFGIPSIDLARGDMMDPQTSGHRTYATTTVREEPPSNPLMALLDPQGSAIFWIALAGVLGLVLITGQVRFEAALGGRAGKR